MVPGSLTLLALAWSLCGGAQTGVDRLGEEEFHPWVAGKRAGLITNQTGVDCNLRSTIDVLNSLPDVELVALFSPEHGLSGDVQAGENVASTRRVYSLYGESRSITDAMLSEVDVLLFDIQDVGVRFYTYISTMLEGMRAAARRDIPFIVLDRPNPIGGHRVEGPVLEAGMESFVGVHPIPIRHGLTVGEMAGLLNGELQLGAPLRVVPVKGWRRDQWYDDTGLAWIQPSPNMPTLDTASVYPGFCLIEGTNLSEGRGTTRPFEWIGAPWLDQSRLVEALNSLKLPGVRFRPQTFRPTFSKHAGTACNGVQVHVVDRDSFLPVRTALVFLSEVKRLHPDQIQFRKGFDRLAGNSWLRQALQEGQSVASMVQRWEAERARFLETRSTYLLYSAGR